MKSAPILTRVEEERFEDFLRRPDVKDLIYDGDGSWALVFGPNTGIGVPVHATAANKTRSVIITEDITDIDSW